MGKRTRLAGILAVLAGFVVFAVGIVSSSSAAGGGGGLGSGAVTNYVKYVGGKAGKANPKLSPVQIGFFNQQGGAVVIGADATTGAQTAVKYANKNLGGIAGHPIKLVTCFIKTSEQEGTTCGQQFRANKNIDVIDEGGVGTGVDTLYAALAGTKPVIAGVAVTAVDATQKNAVILLGDGLHVLAPYGTYAKQVLHAKTAAVVYENEPGIGPNAQAWINALKAEGITVNSVAYDPTQTDLTGPLTSANAASADIVIPGTDANGCVNMANALKQIGVTNPKKIVANPLCLNAQVISGPRRLPTVDVRHREFAIWRFDRSRPRSLREGHEGVQEHEERRGPVEHRQLRLDAEHDPVPRHGRKGAPRQRGEDHAGAGSEDRQGVQGPAGARRPVAGLRGAQGRPSGLQSAGTVLHLYGEGRVHEVGLMAAAAEVSSFVRKGVCDCNRLSI